jgi:hypothetical protein
MPLFRRTTSRQFAPEFEKTQRAFEFTLRLVEDAKSSLVLSVRSGRIQGVPLASALAAFEEGLGEASDSMPPWRRAETEEHWLACEGALGESLRRAGDLRMERSPEIYEELIGEVGELLDPLDVFADASTAVRALGRG